MNIFVIGCGRWGSLITWYLDHIGHRVTLYGRQSSPRMQSFLATRQNDLLTLPESVGLTTELREAEKDVYKRQAHGQGDIVGDDQHVVGGHLIESRRLAHGFAGEVHIGLGLHHQYFMPFVVQHTRPRLSLIHIEMCIRDSRWTYGGWIPSV